MRRNTLLEVSGRAMHAFARVTMNKANPNPMWQEGHSDFFNSDNRDKVEFLENYGFTATFLPRDEQQQQAGAGGENGEAKKGPAAEGIAAFMGGQRNHPVLLGVGDRRHRPRGLKPGEGAQYDDAGQMTLIRRVGLFLLSLDSKDEKGNMVERMASLRHVEKKKQPKPQKQVSSAGTSQGQKQEDDFKHEGESINTEVRCTKGRIEFRAGDTVVGYYDVAAKRWAFIGDVVRLGDDDATHKVLGDNGAQSKTTTKVFVKTTTDAHPTSLDTRP